MNYDHLRGCGVEAALCCTNQQAGLWPLCYCTKKACHNKIVRQAFILNKGVALFAHFFADAFLAKDAEGDGSGKEDGRERAEYHTEYHGEGK